MKEFMGHFVTMHKTKPPIISGICYVGILFALVVLLGITYRYHDRKGYLRFFKGVQWVQLLSLYAWYLSCQIPLSNSLPLYHCRLAMIGLLILPDKSSIKHYLALMGFSGAIIALVYPIMDPYDFPHITGLSFLMGHFALLVNSFAYLLNHFNQAKIKIWSLPLATFGLDLFLLGVNHLTGGNYGIMKFVPIINSYNPWLNYLVVSSVLSLLLLGVEVSFRRWQKTKSNQSYDVT